MLYGIYWCYCNIKHFSLDHNTTVHPACLSSPVSLPHGWFLIAPDWRHHRYSGYLPYSGADHLHHSHAVWPQCAGLKWWNAGEPTYNRTHGKGHSKMLHAPFYMCSATRALRFKNCNNLEHCRWCLLHVKMYFNLFILYGLNSDLGNVCLSCASQYLGFRLTLRRCATSSLRVAPLCALNTFN